MCILKMRRREPGPWREQAELRSEAHWLLGNPTCRDPDTQPSLLHKNQASGFRERNAFLEGSQRAMD